ARAIAVIAEQLLSSREATKFAGRYPGQLLERCGERRLRRIAERHSHGDDRQRWIAQHDLGLLQPVLPEPDMRRHSSTFLEGAAEMKARKAGVCRQRRQRDVRIVFRAKALQCAT